MKKIVYIKDHIDFKAGEMDNVAEEMANYFVLCGVADLIEEKIIEPIVKEPVPYVPKKTEKIFVSDKKKDKK